MGETRPHQRGNYNNNQHNPPTQTCKQQDQKEGGEVLFTFKGNGNGQRAPPCALATYTRQRIRIRLHKGGP